MTAGSRMQLEGKVRRLLAEPRCKGMVRSRVRETVVEAEMITQIAVYPEGTVNRLHHRIE